MDALEIFGLLVAGGLALTLTLGAVLSFDRTGRERSNRPLGPGEDRRLP